MGDRYVRLQNRLERGPDDLDDASRGEPRRARREAER